MSRIGASFANVLGRRSSSAPCKPAMLLSMSSAATMSPRLGARRARLSRSSEMRVARRAEPLDGHYQYVVELGTRGERIDAPPDPLAALEDRIALGELRQEGVVEVDAAR